ETLKCTGDIGSFQTVKAMLPLDADFDQVDGLQSIKVYARSRRTHIGHHRKLSTGSRMSVYQRVKNTSSRRLANGGCNFADCGIRGIFHIHIFTLDELWATVKL